MYNREFKSFYFLWQRECDVEYNNIFFHIVGHYMKYSAQYIRSQLAKYITKYIDTVQVVSGDFLQSKGLTVEDYLMHISQPGNRSDELVVYLVSRFCQKYIRVITRDGVWFTGKNTTLEDCHIVLVYLVRGTFCDTILKSAKPGFLVGNCQHHNLLTVIMCMTQNLHSGLLCHAGTPGPWVPTTLTIQIRGIGQFYGAS